MDTFFVNPQNKCFAITILVCVEIRCGYLGADLTEALHPSNLMLLIT